MKNFIYILLTLLFLQTQVQAFNVVYPKNTYQKINSPSTFFVGSVEQGEELYINGIPIELHYSGAFAKSVLLKNGQNIFVLKSSMGEEKKYVIERPLIGVNYKKAEYNQFETPLIVEVSRNGAPIRTTAVQSGINRLAHYKNGMVLSAIGELGDMYKVELSPQNYVWIAKSDVKNSKQNYDKAILYNYKKQQNKKEYIYKFVLSKQTPYSIEENGNLSLKIYNVVANKNDVAQFSFVLNQKLMGYSAEYSGNTLVVKIKKEPKLNKKLPLKNVKIVIDAGHGGSEQGAISCLGNPEKEFNLSISKYLEHELKAMGATVYMTRHFDRFVSLNNRVKYTNDKNAQIFVSIHANSLPDNKNPLEHRGSGVYYYYDEAKPLSESIINAVCKNMAVRNNGIHQASFAVVRNTSAVSVLVETAYVINPDDNSLLIDDDFKRKYAASVAEGIKNYVLQQNKVAIFRKNKIKFIKG